MAERLRIAVTGLAATYPFGGVFWDYMQYVLGLQRLGHDVLYVEDTGRWCYRPVSATFVADGGANARWLDHHLRLLDPGLAGAWFYRDARGRTYGRPWPEVADFCRSADLFLHISASCWMREEYFAAQTVAFLDSDPMYTQAALPADGGERGEDAAEAGAYLRRHDVFFTFAENFDGPDCLVPAGGLRWIPTRQPVLLDRFEAATVPVNQRRRTLTTVASWEPTERGPVVAGREYAGKSVEFERLIDLPARSALPLELALSGPAPRQRLRQRGWRVIDAYPVSCDPWRYRDYLGASLGEWSVAKNAYTASRSGWFSCRSACYLALGVPVIAQDTGFDRAVPVGEGLMSYRTTDEAAACIERLAADPRRHARAARELAAAYFDAPAVLARLLDDAATGPAPRLERETA